MDKCVVRQAIKETKTEKIAGYELLFQTGQESMYNSEVSAADAISGFLLANSTKLVNDRPVFVTFTPSLFLRKTPKMFDADKVIIQIDDHLVIHPLAAPFIKKYCEEGYRFAIDDFQFTPKYLGLLEYAHYIRVRMAGCETNPQKRRAAENIISLSQGLGKKCIATEIETKDMYDLAVAMGADYLEGNYVANTLVSKVEKVQYMQGNFFQLVVAVSKEEPEFSEVEEIVSRDAGLTYALLRLVNSAYFALPRRTASIRQALVTLGIGQLRHWVYMLSFDHEENPGAEEMLKISFLRAKLASGLAAKSPGCSFAPADAYMMGMFSTLSYMVDAPLEELLREIPVTNEIKEGLLNGTGTAGMIQKLVTAYEKADWKTSRQLAEVLRIPRSMLAQIYVDCVEDVNEVWMGLTTDMKRPGEMRHFKSEDDGREHLEDVFS